MRLGNKLMPDRTFRMESVEDIRFLAKPGDVMLAIDLTQGYHHVTVHPKDRTFIGFCWKQQFYQFEVLPFGLKPAPRWFSKIVTVLARSWRADGITVLVYLDDWLFFTHPARVDELRNRILTDCQQAHFRVNLSKSSLTGVTRLTHLGVDVDIGDNKFRVPTHKRDNILLAIEKILSSNKCSARTLAKVTGQITALRLPIGALTTMFCRALHKEIDKAPTWDKP